MFNKINKFSFLIGIILVLISSVGVSAAGDLKGVVTVLKRGKAKPLKSFDNTVVYIKEAVGNLPDSEIIMSQKNKKFSPRITVAMKGQEVVFQNDDKIKHNIFSTDLNFDIGYIGFKETAVKNFDNLGKYKIYCNIHKDMVGDLIISASPFFTNTDIEGNFIIKDIPEGSYTLVAQHIYGGKKEIPIVITAETISQDIILESTQVIRDIVDHPNKFGEEYDDDY